MPRKPTIPRTCRQCGNTFLAIKQGALYCSRACMTDAKRHVCKQCGMVFIAYPSAHRLFCSPACATRSFDARHGPEGAGWRGGPAPRICEICGEPFTVERSRLQRRNGGRFCSRACQGKWLRTRTGEDHHLWKGGVRGERKRARDRTEYKEWRSAVFGRDRYTCQMCGVQGGKLNAHHIRRWRDYLELRYDVSNGVTLCVTCHRAVNHNGASLSYVQRELVL